MAALLPAPAGVSFERVFADTLPAVRVDGTQIRQVVMNLITNAVDSIGDGEGSITLRVDARVCERSLFESSTYLGEPLDAGTYVVLEVTDTGCGMDEDTLGRMFDPFFSTKFTGRGLGLAAALGIIRAHFGAIAVESRFGHGTCARIYLPASDDFETGSAQTGVVAAWSSGGIALLIEDEAPVRLVAKGMLERVGFKVVVAASGEEGFDALRAHGSDIRIALIDLLMPGLSGSETLRLLRGLRPDLRVLLMSGCGELEAVGQLGGARADAYLQKPFTLAEFRAAVRAALRE